MTLDRFEPIAPTGDGAEATRLRIATRTNQLLLLAIVAAIGAPLFLHYTGFDPQPTMGSIDYPNIPTYKLRLTPGLEGQHGIDFSQIWLSAQKLSAGERVYYPVDKQLWRREWSSTYHPFIHFLYIPIGKLKFQPALILHNLLSIASLLLGAFFVLRRAGCAAAFPSVGLVVVAAMYLTPTGLLHLERGQMDAFVGASMTCTVGLFLFGGRGLAIAAAVLSTLKVQAWIFVGLFAAVAAPLWGLRDRHLWYVPATIALITLPFYSQLVEWIPSLQYVAGNTSTHGSPFNRVIPQAAAYALPFASTAAVGVAAFFGLRDARSLADANARRSLLRRISFPFAVMLAMQTVGSTDVTHDYRMVAFLGLLPILPIWCARAEGISSALRWTTALGFAAMLTVALRIRPFTLTPFDTTALVLLGFSLAFTTLTIYLAAHPPDEVASDGAA